MPFKLARLDLVIFLFTLLGIVVFISILVLDLNYQRSEEIAQFSIYELILQKNSGMSLTNGWTLTSPGADLFLMEMSTTWPWKCLLRFFARSVLMALHFGLSNWIIYCNRQHATSKNHLETTVPTQ